MSDAPPIYLDHNATTPVDPRVLAAMLPTFSELYGNPANGLHRLGRAAARALDTAREQAAGLIGARPHEVFFTSGATESNILAIDGLARGVASTRRRIVTAAAEHKAVLEPCRRLAARGWDVVVLPIRPDGTVDPAAAAAAIDDNTLLVTVQAANNETGVLQPIEQLAGLAHAHGALFHTDAAQMVGKLPLDVAAAGIDLLSASAHKLYGPKGVGLLYVRGGTRHIPLEPLLLGGGQESGLRSGTSNVPGIVGFGVACELARAALPEESERTGRLRDRLEALLIERVPGLDINGAAAARLPNTSSLTFPGIEADALLLGLPDVMLGTGSACTSGAIEPSHVLTAMGLGRAAAYATVRVGLGRGTTAAEIERAAAGLVAGWAELRGMD